MPKTFIVTDIQYDTDGEPNDSLPKQLNIVVPDEVKDDEVEDYISDEISNRTGYCHFGFVTNPEIKS